MKTKEEILELLRDAGASTRKEMMDALENGELMGKLGISDEDQEAVEELHSEMTRRKTIVGLTERGKETALGYWQSLAKGELVNPEGLFSEIIERCADTWSWDHPEQGADWELSSSDSKSGNPELCTFLVSDFVFEEFE